MKLKNNSYLITIISLAIAIVGMSIGLVFSRINDSSYTKTETSKAPFWDVHIESIENLEHSDDIDINKDVTKTNDLTVMYEVSLREPNDIYEFDIVVKNSGNYDAKLKNIIINGNSDQNTKQIITYNGNDFMNYLNYMEGNILLPGESEVIHVKLSNDVTDSYSEHTGKDMFTVTLVYEPAN